MAVCAYSAGIDMTQDEIIKMPPYLNAAYEGDDLFTGEQLRAAVLAEREACANLCWKNEDDNAFINSFNGKRLDLLCAELIRARGEA